jgi:amino acid permease
VLGLKSCATTPQHFFPILICKYLITSGKLNSHCPPNIFLTVQFCKIGREESALVLFLFLILWQKKKNNLEVNRVYWFAALNYLVESIIWRSKAGIQVASYIILQSNGKKKILVCSQITREWYHSE